MQINRIAIILSLPCALWFLLAHISYNRRSHSESGEGSQSVRNATAADFGPLPTPQPTPTCIPEAKLIARLKQQHSQTLDIEADIAFGENQPLEKLLRALECAPHIKQFRVSWSGHLGGNSINGEVLYNRLKPTLKYYFYSADWGQVSEEHYLFTGVTGRILSTLLHDHPSHDTDAGFSNLSHYGCLRKELHKWL